MRNQPEAQAIIDRQTQPTLMQPADDAACELMMRNARELMDAGFVLCEDETNTEIGWFERSQCPPSWHPWLPY